jgi:hypothetical protein
MNTLRLLCLLLALLLPLRSIMAATVSVAAMPARAAVMMQPEHCAGAPVAEPVKQISHGGSAPAVDHLACDQHCAAQVFLLRAAVPAFAHPGRVWACAPDPLAIGAASAPPLRPPRAA